MGPDTSYHLFVKYLYCFDTGKGLNRANCLMVMCERVITDLFMLYWRSLAAKSENCNPEVLAAWEQVWRFVAKWLVVLHVLHRTQLMLQGNLATLKLDIRVFRLAMILVRLQKQKRYRLSVEISKIFENEVWKAISKLPEVCAKFPGCSFTVLMCKSRKVSLSNLQWYFHSWK